MKSYYKLYVDEHGVRTLEEQITRESDIEWAGPPNIPTYTPTTPPPRSSFIRQLLRP